MASECVCEGVLTPASRRKKKTWTTKCRCEKTVGGVRCEPLGCGALCNIHYLVGVRRSHLSG